ncbi:hypothetical protein GCM10028824_36520 [Hymenobacter segetis]|uniref:RNA polymerase sigma factor 70 region 4 type 2 domain-containing protein n=1 Tax=Hymenobacter segetis TaxID=2025509 RepID=A0ABU9M075_9BACT
MYGYYEGLREMARHPSFFTDAMREELSLLRQQLEDGTDDENFPWERHDSLLLRQRLSNLPEHFKSLALERLRELVKLKSENYTEIARALTIPVTPANASRLANRLEGLKQTRDRLDNALKTHKQLEELEKELFVPELASASPGKSPAPASNPARTTIEELCIAPFTKSDLDQLLQQLRLIDSQNNCLTNNLEGKAAGLRSKFTAVYRVLQRARLMDSTANDAEWANAFRSAYHAEIGEAAQKHELTAHGHAASTSSQPFKKGVAEVTTWVSNWRENQS